MYVSSNRGGCLTFIILGVFFIFLLSIFFQVLVYFMPVFIVIAVVYAIYCLIMYFISGGKKQKGTQTRDKYDDSARANTTQHTFDSKDVIDVEYTIVEDEITEK